MTDKARELLERACNYIDSLGGDSKSYRIELSTPEPEQDDEPVAYRHLHEDGWEYYDAPTGDDCNGCHALYLHPAPRPEFVRLSEEEVNSLTYAPYEPYELICAVENRLAEKNSER